MILTEPDDIASFFSSTEVPSSLYDTVKEIQIDKYETIFVLNHNDIYLAEELARYGKIEASFAYKDTIELTFSEE